ncbi:MAG: UDP-N-acetylglucosamine 2-epimerase (non-hydrolyzing) [Bryobacteraceae bacterium]|nr:UDP-N-acetylglucosamine 2-epimerase (non-hydrolyzing) [Bryobacteraceae bacterium]
MSPTGKRSSLRVLCVGGARPNFMKLAPLMEALRSDSRFHALLVHTGQHYDHQMSGAFFRDLGLPDPDFYLGVGSGSHAQQTAEILRSFEPVVLDVRPDAVIVVGDVNSTLGCALVASKLCVPVVHVEAGLRSFDRTMPEEVNRVLTDAISELLLVSEPSGVANLRREGIDGSKIHLVGNLMIDSLRRHLEKAEAADLPSRLALPPRGYGVVTLHRPANVDDAEALESILEALADISGKLPLIFPVHPRTRTRLQSSRAWKHGRIRLLDPLSYLEFLSLMARAAAVFTDSGGIQEETTVLGIPCFTLRDNTERPITIEQGTNVLAGTRKETILAAWRRHGLERPNARVPDLWDGEAASRCVQAIASGFGLAS